MEHLKIPLNVLEEPKKLIDSVFEIGRLLEVPIKPAIVIEFEAMTEKQKQRVRDSEDWPEIKKYYNWYHKVVQLNVAEHAWRMIIDREPMGKVEYIYGYFLEPLRRHIPKEYQWIKDPKSDYWHRLDCIYAQKEFDENYKYSCCRRPFIKK